MNPDYIPVMTTVISVVGSLIVAFGTWHVSMAKEREKQMEEVRGLLSNHKEESDAQYRSLQEDITQINSTVQNQIAIIEVKIDTLSERVDKHNSIIDRTYKLEQQTALQDAEIRNIKERIG